MTNLFAAGRRPRGAGVEPEERLAFGWVAFEPDRLTVSDGGQATEVYEDRHFAFTWHPYAIDPAVDYSGETPTLVEFRLAPEAGGTRLDIVESGFDKVPAQRRAEAMRMNDGGWAEQVQNIKAHVES